MMDNSYFTAVFLVISKLEEKYCIAGKFGRGKFDEL